MADPDNTPPAAPRRLRVGGFKATVSDDRLEIETSSLRLLRIFLGLPFVIYGAVFAAAGVLGDTPFGFVAVPIGIGSVGIGLLLMLYRAGVDFDRRKQTVRTWRGLLRKGKGATQPLSGYRRVSLDLCEKTGVANSWSVRLEGHGKPVHVCTLRVYAHCRELAARLGSFLDLNVHDQAAGEVRTASSLPRPSEPSPKARIRRRAAPPWQFSLWGLIAVMSISAMLLAFWRMLDSHYRVGLVFFPTCGAAFGVLLGAVFGATLRARARQGIYWAVRGALLLTVIYLVMYLVLLVMIQSKSEESAPPRATAVLALMAVVAVTCGFLWNAYRRQQAGFAALEHDLCKSLPDDYKSILTHRSPVSAQVPFPWYGGTPFWYFRDVDTGLRWLLAALPKRGRSPSVLALDSPYTVVPAADLRERPHIEPRPSGRPAKQDEKIVPFVKVLRALARALEDPRSKQADASLPAPLERLRRAVAIGEADTGEILFLDPTDGHAVCSYRPSDGAVEKLERTFAHWLRRSVAEPA